MRVIITGASGLIGTALTARLKADGHEPVALVRRAAGAGEIRWDPAKGELSAEALAGADAVVNLAGAGIGDHRWTDSYKREILDSRVRATSLLAERIAECSERPPVLLSGSAIGAYGVSESDEFDEGSPFGAGFLADVCRQWEAAAAPAAAVGTRVAFLRTGIVLSKRGGALKKLLPLFKLGLGGKFGHGRQWWSWVSMTDEVGAIVHLLNAPVSGPVNLTGPAPTTNTEFTRTLAKVMHRPAFVPVPSFGPKLLLGSELADSLLFTGQKVQPRALQASGYVFAHPTAEAALRAELA